MTLQNIQFLSGFFNQQKADLLIVPSYEKEALASLLKELDQKFSLKIHMKEEKFDGSKDSSFTLSLFASKQYKRIVVLGLGKEKLDSSEAYKDFGARAAECAKAHRAKSCVLILPNEHLDLYQIKDYALGLHLSQYYFSKHMKNEKGSEKAKWTFVPLQPLTFQPRKALERAKQLAIAIADARDMINESPVHLTPIAMADHAKKIAKKHQLKLKILNESQIKKENMNLYWAVSSGSTANPPRFIHLSYIPKKQKNNQKKVFLIGKGVTFDSGGLSLKPGKAMENMKIDMSGAAAVLSAITVIAQQALNFEVHAVVAATENMPDGASYRPGDIIKSKNGLSVEVLNTDAEGRLTLADAMTYCIEKGATEMIDLATLTGACMVALGPYTAALYSHQDELAKGLQEASQKEGEDLWRMPLTKKLKKQLKSPVADLKNIGGPYGGSITAALFLEAFAGDTTWAHLDIAGPATSDADQGYLKKGGRGFGVSTLVEYLCPLMSKG